MIPLENNSISKFNHILIIVILLCGLGSSVVTHHEAREYQDSIRPQEDNKTHLNNYRRPSDWDIEGQINKYNIDKKGIIEINRFHNQIANESQVESAWSLYNKTYHNVREEGWFNKSKGFNDSYFNSSISFSHYPNRKFLYDRRTLDPERPEYLMYYKDWDTGEQKLLGVMYMTNSINETGTQIGGPLTKWHYHRFSDDRCFENDVFNLGPRFTLEDKDKCDGTFSKISPEMLHVWFIERDNGPFSTDMWENASKYPKIPEKISEEEFKDRLWKSYPEDILQCKPIN